jgi:hypothetical protein
MKLCGSALTRFRHRCCGCCSCTTLCPAAVCGKPRQAATDAVQTCLFRCGSLTEHDSRSSCCCCCCCRYACWARMLLLSVTSGCSKSLMAAGGPSQSQQKRRECGRKWGGSGRMCTFTGAPQHPAPRALSYCVQLIGNADVLQVRESGGRKSLTVEDSATPASESQNSLQAKKGSTGHPMEVEVPLA